MTAEQWQLVLEGGNTALLAIVAVLLYRVCSALHHIHAQQRANIGVLRRHEHALRAAGLLLICAAVFLLPGCDMRDVEEGGKRAAEGFIAGGPAGALNAVLGYVIGRTLEAAGKRIPMLRRTNGPTNEGDAQQQRLDSPDE